MLLPLRNMYNDTTDTDWGPKIFRSTALEVEVNYWPVVNQTFFFSIVRIPTLAKNCILHNIRQ